MANKILIKRGLKANMPILSEGELGYPTDTRELFIGTGGGNVNIGGSHWYCGTAMSGTSTTTGAYSYSACPQVKLGDLYLNTSYGYVYQCTTAGSGTSAKWTYQGSIRGAAGTNATTTAVATSSTKGLMSAADKAKLDGVATGANNYTHPSSHAASMITQDSTHRFVTDTEKSSWNNKADADILDTFSSNSFVGIDEVTTAVNELHRTATFVIAASNSNGSGLYHADYKCTGTDDQNKINAAIAALPSSGGKIVLLDGTYNITGPITVNKANVTIEGMGNSTVLQRRFNGSNDKIGLITVTGDNCIVSSMKINGNKTTYSYAGNNSVFVSGCKYATIRNLTTDDDICGIKICSNVYFAKLISNTITNGKVGIYSDHGWDSVIAFNQIDTMSECCILLDQTSCRNLLLANRCTSAVQRGIGTDNGSVNTTIIANHCYFSNKNISINSGYNTIVGNFCKQTGDSSTSDYSIVVESSGQNNLVANNLLFAKNYINNGGTTNTFANNKYN